MAALLPAMVSGDADRLPSRAGVEGCSSRSEGQFPRPFQNRENLTAGPFALVGAAGRPSWFEPAGGQKFPLIVKTGRRVTVSIPRRAAGFAGLTYGGRGSGYRDARRKVTFIACERGEAAADRLRYRPFWSGFVLTDGPRCVPLRIRANGDGVRHLMIHLGVETCETERGLIRHAGTPSG